MGDTLEVTATLRNDGPRAAEEVVQLYIRDLVGNVTRPIRELKRFCRVRLEPGASERVSFHLHTDDLAFYNQRMERVTEPGQFHVWIGGSAEADLGGEFEVIGQPAG
jgi:beta-glucosidase